MRFEERDGGVIFALEVKKCSPVKAIKGQSRMLYYTMIQLLS